MSDRNNSSGSFSLNDARKVAETLALKLRRGDVVTLSGDLGAGKTTFAQFLIRFLGGDGLEVTSPTFTLLQTYPLLREDLRGADIAHYDLYRIEHASQLAELGFEEALQGITLIEWPERLEGYSLPVTLALLFTLEESGVYRITILGGDPRFDEILA